VVHLDVNAAMIDEAARRIAEVLARIMPASAKPRERHTAAR
jgi:hypothetical protein